MKNASLALASSIFAMAACLGDEPVEDGIYLMGKGEQGTKVDRANGGSLFLGKCVGTEFGPAQVWSLSNENDRFRVYFTDVPLPEIADLSSTGTHQVVCIDGVCERVSSYSDNRQAAERKTLEFIVDIRGKEKAARIAKKLGVEMQLRKHPGHQLRTTFTPTQDTFKVGEPVVLEMRIENVGTKTVHFMDGGQQRGPRNNQFGFIASPALPDTGDAMNFGGIAAFRNLEPGETFTKKVDITKWFTFSKPYPYEITGLFELELHRPEFDANYLWDEIVAAKCWVRMVD